MLKAKDIEYCITPDIVEYSDVIHVCDCKRWCENQLFAEYGVSEIFMDGDYLTVRLNPYTFDYGHKEKRKSTNC